MSLDRAQVVLNGSDWMLISALLTATPTALRSYLSPSQVAQLAGKRTVRVEFWLDSGQAVDVGALLTPAVQKTITAPTGRSAILPVTMTDLSKVTISGTGTVVFAVYLD